MQIYGHLEGFPLDSVLFWLVVYQHSRLESGPWMYGDAYFTTFKRVERSIAIRSS